MHEYTYITQAPAHLSIIIDNAQQHLQPTFTDNKQGLEAGNTAVQCRKHGSSIVLEKEILQVKFEGVQSFCWRGRERSFHVEWQKTEKVEEATVEILVRGICRLGVSEAECQAWEGV